MYYVAVMFCVYILFQDWNLFYRCQVQNEQMEQL